MLLPVQVEARYPGRFSKKPRCQNVYHRRVLQRKPLSGFANRASPSAPCNSATLPAFTEGPQRRQLTTPSYDPEPPCIALLPLLTVNSSLGAPRCPRCWDGAGHAVSCSFQRQCQLHVWRGDAVQQLKDPEDFGACVKGAHTGWTSKIGTVTAACETQPVPALGNVGSRSGGALISSRTDTSAT